MRLSGVQSTVPGLSVLWFHIPYIILVHGTSNGPQNDIDNHLGPCSKLFCSLLRMIIELLSEYNPKESLKVLF